MCCVIIASGALWRQFQSLILHLYQTLGGKQAENQHDISSRNYDSPRGAFGSYFDQTRINTTSRHACVTISLLSICPFHPTNAASLKDFSNDPPRQLGFKELHIRDPLCVRSVPLNPTALMCHILALFSALIHALLPCPMEVIRRAPFLLDRRANKRLVLQMSCHMCNPLCQLEMRRTFFAVATTTRLNNRATSAEPSLRHVLYGPRLHLDVKNHIYMCLNSSLERGLDWRYICPWCNLNMNGSICARSWRLSASSDRHCWKVDG